MHVHNLEILNKVCCMKIQSNLVGQTEVYFNRKLKQINFKSKIVGVKIEIMRYVHHACMSFPYI